MPPGIRNRFAFCEIASPGGMLTAEGFSFGAYLQFPGAWCTIHYHAAKELYFILGGTAEWSLYGVAA
jgi:mannose-6-phosphate isomerase-like protein (cupin superfamily)